MSRLNKTLRASMPAGFHLFIWWREADLNHRPSGYAYQLQLSLPALAFIDSFNS